ncbi:unnamed protein product [Ambrosiozyma monospora]|uniref:Unnamed protein product n=1 Tax=Ambrosiozyma monospora TaxID=43982 RepID=A0ACB5SSW6_AMBMO|nr:unnamed protein product [Ambrosiozyma monospora]
MNDILRLRDRQIALNNSLGTFHKLIEPDPGGPGLTSSTLDVIAQKVRLKLKLLRVMTEFSVYIINIISDGGIFPPSELTAENLALLQKLKITCDADIKRIFSIGCRFIAEFSGGGTVFGNKESFYLTYFKADLLRMIMPTCLVMTFSISGEIFGGNEGISYTGDVQQPPGVPNVVHNSPGNPTPSVLPSLREFDYNSIETSIGDPITEHSPYVSSEMLLMLRCPRQLITVFVDLHNAIAGMPVLSENYGFFCLLKILSVFACFAHVIVNMDINLKNGNPNLPHIMNETKKKIEETMIFGYVDLGLKLDDDYTTIQHWLDSMFDEGGFHGLLDQFLNSADHLAAPDLMNLDPSHVLPSHVSPSQLNNSTVEPQVAAAGPPPSSMHLPNGFLLNDELFNSVGQMNTSDHANASSNGFAGLPNDFLTVQPDDDDNVISSDDSPAQDSAWFTSAF